MLITKKLKIFIIVSLTLFLGLHSYAIVPDQTMIERALKDNRYFLDFINVAVSNFGTRKQEKLFGSANRTNFNAHRFFLRSNFSKAYKEIRASHETLRDLYNDILNNRFHIDAQYLLDMSAPVIIQSRDKLAERYLRLGYRDLEVSKQFYKVALNYNRFLFSNKIHFYIDSIKRARRAKRFAFYALIESKKSLSEKKRFQTQTLNQALNKSDYVEEKQPDYIKVRNTLKNLISRKIIVNNAQFFLHHDDNFGLINKNKTSILKLSIKELYKTEVSKPSNLKKVNTPKKNKNNGVP